MKKTLVFLLSAVILLPLVSCSGTGEAPSKDALFRTVCSADDALERAKAADAVVFEGMRCTSGSDVWDAFYQAVGDQTPASVLCAHYYVLNRERMSEELYEEQKDQYPKLFFYLVEYDGSSYTVTIRQSTEETASDPEAFACLLHFTGAAPSTATFSSYEYYVLADDPTATWDGIMAGLLSSQFGAGYRHCTVYKNVFD